MNPRTARLRRHGFWYRHRVLIMVGGGFLACFVFVALGRHFGLF